MTPPGPLRLHATDPRYFDDGSGRAVYLAGSHHWDVLQDNEERPEGFDFPGYLDRLTAWGHNFIRFWTHEAWTRRVHPLPYPRTARGFDLSRFDPEYFERLRQRVVLAGERGFYVGVMLFNGWSIHDNGEGNPWDHHPFNFRNNINRIDGDPDACGDGLDVHTLRVPAITRLQEAYVEKVVATLGDLPHLLWEISNESPPESRDWQYHLIRYLKALDPSHPVGMTACHPRGKNEDLFRSPADWISPNDLGGRGGYKTSPPPADGRKVVLLDTDHLWGIGGDARWVWKAFVNGHHLLYMDPLDADPEREAARQAMGEAVRLAKRLDLARVSRQELLTYLPKGREEGGPLRLENS